MIPRIESLSVQPLLTSRIERDVIAGLFGVRDGSGRLLLHYIDHDLHKIIECDQADYSIHVSRWKRGQRLACEVVGANVVFARQLPNGHWQAVYSAEFTPDQVVHD